MMNLHQRGLVDACFEEGQYDEGIALLSQLKSQNVAPSPSHIRQLLYLSLYPPVMKKQPVDSNLSPSKIVKQQRPIAISHKTATSARTLLLQFAVTNHPDDLARALPSYSTADDNEREDSESFIARKSSCIAMTKNCWNILQRGFIRRAVTSSPTKKSSTVYEEDDDDDFAISDVVAEHAWPILDFILILYERDERETTARGLPRYSPLLLDQIPASRSGKGARWEAEAPLSVILFAINQNNERLQSMGARLTQLLINLCCTNLFEFTMFLNLVFNKIYASAPTTFLTLLASLPPTIPLLKFRIALLHKFICSNGQNPTTDTSLRPRVRAKPVPRARGEVNTVEGTSTSLATPTLSQIALPSFTEICRVVEELQPKSTETSYLWIQSQLLSSFGLYQSQLPAEARDEGWQKFLAAEDLPQQLDKFFVNSQEEDAIFYKRILNVALPVLA
ncbi:hypothetical protein D9757_000780 [Collybiopsis confluens]|uniref:Uncharacterized protein n=1 Tax=Collybiopsis confluens TaxID=2823264 RepID=A0A8H5MH37_9AGAR|nr:hypothetical protein D9757_000780 [Collybiopsis confluens]